MDNKMSWDKCRGCEFLVNVNTRDVVEFFCAITKEVLVITNCVKDSETYIH